MSNTISEILAQARAWIGKKESDQSFRIIIDIYNSHRPLARGYQVKYTDSWCATFVSAVAIRCNATYIIPPECGCQEMIKLFQSNGEWEENEARIPHAGDIIFYDWDDSGVGNNTGYADHVGIVEKISSSTITVIEGNKSNAVGRRNIAVNARYIRGYGIPRYQTERVTTSKKKPLDTIAREVIAGKWGNGDARKNALIAAGYDYSAIQARVNELLKNPEPAAVYYTVKSGDTLSAIARKYGTTALAIQKLNPTRIKNINHIITGWEIRVK